MPNKAGTRLYWHHLSLQYQLQSVHTHREYTPIQRVAIWTQSQWILLITQMVLTVDHSVPWVNSGKRYPTSPFQESIATIDYTLWIESPSVDIRVEILKYHWCQVSIELPTGLHWSTLSLNHKYNPCRFCRQASEKGRKMKVEIWLQQ